MADPSYLRWADPIRAALERAAPNADAHALTDEAREIARAALRCLDTKKRSRPRRGTRKSLAAIIKVERDMTALQRSLGKLGQEEHAVLGFKDSPELLRDPEVEFPFAIAITQTLHTWKKRVLRAQAELRARPVSPKGRRRHVPEDRLADFVADAFERLTGASGSRGWGDNESPCLELVASVFVVAGLDVSAERALRNAREERIRRGRNASRPARVPSCDRPREQ